MSFLSKLLKGVTIGAGALAAPLTFGASIPAVIGAAGMGAMAGKGVGDRVTAGIDGGDDQSVWDENGNFIGGSWFPDEGNGTGGKSPWLAGLEKYGVPAAASAIQGVVNQNNASANRDVARSGQALTESQLDPFRGVMHQSHDLNALDMASNYDASPTQVQVDPKYGAGLNVAAMVKQPYKPSDQTRGVMHNAMDMIANGTGAAPSYTNPKNIGRPLPLAGFSSAQASAGAPAGPGAPPMTDEERRRLGLAPVDENPWMTSI